MAFCYAFLACFFAFINSAASVMKVYPQSLVNIKADDTQKALFGSDTEIAEKIRALSSSLSGNGRILVRPSGTEPKDKFYYTAVASTEAEAKQLLDAMIKQMSA